MPIVFSSEVFADISHAMQRRTLIAVRIARLNAAALVRDQNGGAVMSLYERLFKSIVLNDGGTDGTDKETRYKNGRF